VIPTRVVLHDDDRRIVVHTVGGGTLGICTGD
jgi:hypothetical protein